LAEQFTFDDVKRILVDRVGVQQRADAEP